MNELLTIKYGNPYVDTSRNLKDEMFLSDKEIYIDSMKEGKFDIYSRWKVSDTSIKSSISSKGGKLNFTIKYESLAHIGLGDTCELQKALKKL